MYSGKGYRSIPSADKFAATLTVVLSALGAALLCLLVVNAIRSFAPSYDYIAYHLPWALDLAGFNVFRWGKSLDDARDGLPILADYLQGLLIVIFGNENLGNTINLLALAVLLIYAKIVLNIRPFILFVIISACPMLLLQLPGGYIDAWSAIFLALGILSSGVYLLRPKQPVQGFLAVFFLGVASLSKIQTWAFCWVTLVALVLLTALGRKIKLALLFSVVGAILVLMWPVRNLWLYGNPTHPFGTPVIAKLLKIENSRLFDDKNVVIPNYLRGAPPIKVFLYSLLEVGYEKGGRLSNVTWTEDSGYVPPGHKMDRMGGYNRYFVIVTCGVAAYLFLSGWHVWPTRFIFFVGLTLTGFLGIIALVPGLEPRYILFLPVLLSVFFYLGMQRLPKTFFLVAVMGFSIAWLTTAQDTFTRVFYPLSKIAFAQRWSHEYSLFKKSPLSSDQEVVIVGFLPIAIRFVGDGLLQPERKVIDVWSLGELSVLDSKTAKLSKWANPCLLLQQSAIPQDNRILCNSHQVIVNASDKETILSFRLDRHFSNLDSLLAVEECGNNLAPTILSVVASTDQQQVWSQVLLSGHLYPIGLDLSNVNVLCFKFSKSNESLGSCRLVFKDLSIYAVRK